MGASVASTLFAVALLASGQSFNHYRNFSRSNRDGRIFEYPHQTVAASPYHALSGDHSGDDS